MSVVGGRWLLFESYSVFSHGLGVILKGAMMGVAEVWPWFVYSMVSTHIL